MQKIKQEDIHLISKHSNWSEQSIDVFLKQEIYAKAEDWKKFLRLFLLTLGVCFSTAGIVFFFAYNWADLHKFAKIGMVEAGIVLLTLAVLLTKIDLDIKKIILTGTSVLVGVLFAVFGQIYQTGANAYDFFLGWTVFIALWVFAINFPPLWLVFLTLINTTFILYTEQVAYYWDEFYLFCSLFFFNLLALVCFLVIDRFTKEKTYPQWFSNTLSLAIIWFGTTTIIRSILGSSNEYEAPIIISILAVFASGIYYGYRAQRSFYIAIIVFSAIIICSTFMLERFFGSGMVLVVCVFVISSTSLLIKTIIELQKKWKHAE